MEQVIELLEKREEYFDGLTYYAGMDRLKISKDVKIYSFGEDLSYFVIGNITNYFRWIQIVDKWYVLTFELYD